MGRGTALALLWVAGAIGSAQVAADPDALLVEIKLRAAANLNNLPDFICRQTVKRTIRDSVNEEFRPLDTLHVEVGLMGDRELYAWPDSARFGEQELADMVQRGTIGNGNFALHARNVFLSDGPEFRFRGEEDLDGRPTYRYDFEIPVEESQYHLRVSPFQARVALRGSFWADRESLDLVRLSVVAVDIPLELGIAEMSDRMDYERVTIGESDALLPKSSELLLVGKAGNATRNLTSFDSCHQYVGESSISFHGSSPDRTESQAPEAGAETFSIPAEVLLELALAEAIDSRQAAVGDPIRAVLAKPLKDGSEVLAPKGAVVHGRLVRVDQYDRPLAHFVLGIELHTLEFANQRAAFAATMRQVSGANALLKQSRRLDPTFKKKRKAFMGVLVNESQRGQGIILWKADNPVVKAGLKMRWEVEP